MPGNSKTHSRRWKNLFIILAVVNIAVIVTFVTLLFWPVKEAPFPDSKQQVKGNSSEFVIRTTKENLNDMIAAYLDNVLKDNKYHYQVRLEDDVHLVGELPVFSSTVPLSVHLNPIVQDNGDVILKLENISVGLLQLPNKKIMEYIEDYLPMPEWVKVNPRAEEIYVALQDMDIKSNFQVEAAHVDLPANNIAFKISVPYDEIGLD